MSHDSESLQTDRPPPVNLVLTDEQGYDNHLQATNARSPNIPQQYGNHMSNNPKHAAYQSSSYSSAPQAGNPRHTEAWALVESARRLGDAIEHSPCEDTSPTSPVRAALRLNWRLWTIFQTELSLSDDSIIPPDIRQNMLSLCNFVDKQTVDAIAKPTPEKISALIEINRNIANGLLESINADAGESAAEPSNEVEAPALPSSIDEDI